MLLAVSLSLAAPVVLRIVAKRLAVQNVAQRGAAFHDPAVIAFGAAVHDHDAAFAAISENEPRCAQRCMFFQVLCRLAQAARAGQNVGCREGGDDLGAFVARGGGSDGTGQARDICLRRGVRLMPRTASGWDR